MGLPALPAVLAFHAAAYAATKAARSSPGDARAVTLVVGMQSSTLATVLCTAFTPHLPTAVVPTVLSTIVMAVSGIALGAKWPKSEQEE